MPLGKPPSAVQDPRLLPAASAPGRPRVVRSVAEPPLPPEFDEPPLPPDPPELEPALPFDPELPFEPPAPLLPPVPFDPPAPLDVLDESEPPKPGSSRSAAAGRRKPAGARFSAAGDRGSGSEHRRRQVLALCTPHEEERAHDWEDQRNAVKIQKQTSASRTSLGAVPRALMP